MGWSPRRWPRPATRAPPNSASSPSPRARALARSAPRAGTGASRRPAGASCGAGSSPPPFGHALLLVALLWMPTPKPAEIPGVVTVDLSRWRRPPAAGKSAPLPQAGAGQSAAAGAARRGEARAAGSEGRRGSEARAAQTGAAEARAAEPPKPPPPPPPPKNETVIPKTPQKEPEKPKEKPEPEARAQAEARARAETQRPSRSRRRKRSPSRRRRSRPPPKPKPKPQESYDDVLADLRAERGESRPDPVERPTRAANAAKPGAGGTATTPGARASGTASVTPEVAAWLRAARLHVRQAWVLPAGFRREPLETQVEVELDAQGNVLSEPKVVRRSGNPWYDESVVRAVQKASPLPPAARSRGRGRSCSNRRTSVDASTARRDLAGARARCSARRRTRRKPSDPPVVVTDAGGNAFRIAVQEFAPGARGRRRRGPARRRAGRPRVLGALRAARLPPPSSARARQRAHGFARLSRLAPDRRRRASSRA